MHGPAGARPVTQAAGCTVVDAAQAAALAQSLAGPGHAVVPGFLDAALVRELALELDGRAVRGELRAAAVGAGARRMVLEDVRGDRIQWLREPGTRAEAAALSRLEALRLALNERLYLGLHELECHYALYPPGAHYARHLDRSPAGVERVVSIVLYLNPGWDARDGGELRLHLPDGTRDVVPQGGTLAVFLSERLEHEVRPATRPRRSLTGWFRRRPLGAPLV
ncbi:MAG: 2OG-Fe(II) oxygenase [Steroidobacteraceae bacterium]|jgi:SM-20-related protein|nr:2OG-Fe(II) oxygenase [Steroidobacteraceae bacterium]